VQFRQVVLLSMVLTACASAFGQAPNCSIPAADFGMTISPASQSITAGQTANFTVTVYPWNGCTGPIALTISGMPSGMTATLNGSSSLNASPGTSTLGFTNASAQDGTYPLTITGTFGSMTHHASVSLTTSGPPGPVISAIAPTSGPVGAAVTITGTNFGTTLGGVTFSGVAAQVNTWSATSIVALAPPLAANGNVVVTLPSGVSSSGVGFTFTSPYISSLSATSGPVGLPLTLIGGNFGSSQGTSTITVNGVAAAPTSWSSTTIVFPVPSAASGFGDVVVTVNGVATNPNYGPAFSVTPAISGISPKTGLAGTAVTVTGTGFGPAPGGVSFNGSFASATSWSTTSIVVPVPSGATTGNVVVSTGGGQSNGVLFTLTSPYISSITPNPSPAGASVTIAGAEFGATQGTSTVTFSGVPVIASSWSASSIAAPVPAGITSGNVIVTVSGLASNGVSFTIGAFLPTGSTSQALEYDTATPLNDGMVLVVGGCCNGGSTPLGSAELYDPATGTFAATGSLNTARYNHTATLLNNGTVLVTGGIGSGGGALSSAELYNPATGTFTYTGSLNTTLEDHTAILLGNGEVLIVGGTGSVGYAVAAELYNPTTGTFGATGDLNTWRENSLAVLLENGLVLIAGGTGLSGQLTSAELYNPSTGNFSLTGNMNFKGQFRTATLLSSGMVLIAGGYDSSIGILANAELYNPSTGTFTLTGSMEVPRESHGAALLNNGMVLVAGGNNSSNLTSAELYNPATGTFSYTSNLSVGSTSTSATTLNDGMVLVMQGQTSNAELYEYGLNIPMIGELSTNSGAVGTSITLTGIDFGAAQGSSTVMFNGTKASPSSWNGTTILAPVPSGATTGNLVVTVGGEPSNGVNFTVPVSVPSITSLSTTSGSPGTSVTLTGTNFGSTQGVSSIVTFNGTMAPPTSWSSTGTSIVVPVPSGATTGKVVVTVGGQASNGISFTVPMPAPSITSLSPTSGPVGTEMTITGTNFGATQATSTITFNGTIATPITWSATSILLFVPAGASTGPVVVTSDSQASNSVTFTVKLGITSLTPSSGPIGASVTIAGGGFGTTKGTSTVVFGTTVATTTSWSNTSIVAVVPTGASTGNVVVTVGGVASNGFSFTVFPVPTITTIPGGPFNWGEEITINGTNFGNPSNMTVTFNGIVAQQESTSSTFVDVLVPMASSGPVVVKVNGAASNSVNVTITGQAVPTIASVSPLSGPVGTAVTITGTNFGASQTTSLGTSLVEFDNVPATPTSWTSTKIVVPVPVGASFGPVTASIFITNSIETVIDTVSGPNFTVTSGSISRISPAFGPVGTPVTISGESFGSTQGSNTVSFNGTVATPVSWGPSQILVSVPTGATTGNVVVTVAGVASNGANFIVGTPPVLTSVSPSFGPPGMPITIAGTNLGASQGASTLFLNLSPTPATGWSATSISTTAPSGVSSASFTVNVGGMPSGAVLFLVSSGPGIISLSPTSGPPGTPITISGLDFGSPGGSVTFNGTPAVATTWNSTKIVALVPAGATTGNVVVAASNGVAFTVTPGTLNISKVAPTSGPVGTSVTITGTGFGSTQGTSSVAFNGAQSAPTSWSTTSIVVPAPSAATTGNVVVAVNGVESNGTEFTIIPAPIIGGLSPGSGLSGTSVTISGSYFGSTQGTSTVTFNGTAATPKDWSATSITVPVPSGATSGNVVVTVGGQASNGEYFALLPNSSGILPTSGPVGTPVTISGVNFGVSQGGSTVTFNGTRAIPTSWSTGSIVVPVPSGATTGSVVVTVGGQASSGITFTVTP
jgi:IPT/TIG domain/Galactose oxidase, central domain